MNDQILEAIKKKAQSSAGLFSTHAQQEFYARAYTSGCIEGIGLMKGFMKILSDKFYEYPNDKWEMIFHDGIEEWGLRYETFYTTDFLLSEYIKTLNNG